MGVAAVAKRFTLSLSFFICHVGGYKKEKAAVLFLGVELAEREETQVERSPEGINSS